MYNKLYVHAYIYRKDDVIGTAGQTFTISINPSVTHSTAHNAHDTMDLQPQEQIATVHVNPSASENLARDEISYNVEPVTAEASKTHYPCDPKEETPLY